MPVTFLHTADWQLGKPFASVRDEAKRHRLQQERLHAVQRLADLAKESGAAFVLVAGDLFDSAQVTKHTVSAACAAIGTVGVPVVVTRGITTTAVRVASGSRTISRGRRRVLHRIFRCCSRPNR